MQQEGRKRAPDRVCVALKGGGTPSFSNGYVATAIGDGTAAGAGNRPAAANCPAHRSSGHEERPRAPAIVLLAHCRGRRDQGLSRSSTERLLHHERQRRLCSSHASQSTTSLPGPPGQQCCIPGRWARRRGLQAVAPCRGPLRAAARPPAALCRPASLPGRYGGRPGLGAAGATSCRRPLPCARSHPNLQTTMLRAPPADTSTPQHQVMSTPESNMSGAPPPTAPMPVPTPHAPPAGNGAAAAPGATPGRSPRPMGLPPPSPAQPGSLPRGSGRRSMDGGNSRRSTDGGRRSIDGGRRGRHTVEVPEGAERHEGLVVSRQEKVRCMLSLVCCLLFGHRCKLRNASIGMRVRVRSCCEVWQLAPIWRTSLDSCRDELACSITCCCCRCCSCSTQYCCAPAVVLQVPNTSAIALARSAVWLHQVQHPRGALLFPRERHRRPGGLWLYRQVRCKLLGTLPVLSPEHAVPDLGSGVPRQQGTPQML